MQMLILYDNFPNPNFEIHITQATNWITVGASSDPWQKKTSKVIRLLFQLWKEGSGCVCSRNTDLFNPSRRKQIWQPGWNKYGGAGCYRSCSTDLEYFPTLTPEQVKYCIEKSAIRRQKQKNQVQKMKWLPFQNEQIRWDSECLWCSKTGFRDFKIQKERCNS